MATLFLVGLLVPGLATGQTASAPVEVAVIADSGPTADSLTRRVQAEIEALFAGHRSVQTSVTEGAPPWTSAAATDAYQSARAAGPDAIVVVGSVSVAAICVASGPGGSVPTIGVSSGSALLVPDAARESCSVVGPIGWPSRTMRAFEDLTAVSSVAVAVDGRVADHIAGPSRCPPARSGPTEGLGCHGPAPRGECRHRRGPRPVAALGRAGQFPTRR